jgi:hypothetical protein
MFCFFFSCLGPIVNGIVELTNSHLKHEKSPLSTTDEHNESASHVSPRKNFRLYICLTLSSLGVIFGDIGTSPLYVLRTIFHDNPHPTHEQCIGVISLIIWNLLIVVTIKYAVFILMADNRGEGGTFALCGLLTGDKSRLRARAKHVIGIVSIFAASLLIGNMNIVSIELYNFIDICFRRWRIDTGDKCTFSCRRHNNKFTSIEQLDSTDNSPDYYYSFRRTNVWNIENR